MKLSQKYFVSLTIFGLFLLGFVKANPIPTPKGPNAEYIKCIQIESTGEIISGYTSFFVSHSEKVDDYKYTTQYVKTDDYECTNPPLIFIDTTKKNISEINLILQNNTGITREDVLGEDDIILPIPHEYVGGYTTRKYSNTTKNIYFNNYFANLDMDIIYKVEPNGSGAIARKVREITGGNNITTFNDSTIVYSINAKKYFSGIENKQNSKSYFNNFIKSWIMTIILETIILFFLCKLFFKKDNIKPRKIILTGILASSITLPILRFVLPHIFHNYTVYAIVGEVFVTFVEVFIIKYLLDINRQKATIASIACNLFSVIIGLLL